MDEKQKTVLALLFAYGEPLPKEKLARFGNISPDTIDQLMSDVHTALLDTPFAILAHGGSFQLVTRPAYAAVLEAAVKDEISEALSPASLETLAIIAYLGPVPRAKIDYIRGVNSSFILRNLLLRGLVNRAPDPERAHVFIYSVSPDFLRHLGVRELGELPEFERYRKFLEGVHITAAE